MMNEPEKPITESLSLSGYNIEITEAPTEDQECLAWASYCAVNWDHRSFS